MSWINKREARPLFRVVNEYSGDLEQNVILQMNVFH